MKESNYNKTKSQLYECTFLTSLQYAIAVGWTIKVVNHYTYYLAYLSNRASGKANPYWWFAFACHQLKEGKKIFEREIRSIFQRGA